MSVSMNTSQMEALASFGYFLEIIKDPKDLMAIVDDAKKVLAENEKQLGVIKTVKDADAYLENAKNVAAGWAKEQETKDARFAAEVAKSKKELQEQTARVEAIAKEATDKAAQNAVTFAEAALSFQNAKAAEKKAKELEESLSVKLKEVQDKEKELDEKLATVKKMLGE